MTGKTPQERLRDAATEVEAALKGLDIREHACECCKTRRFDNFAHAKAYAALKETPAKLRDAASRLDEKDVHTRRDGAIDERSPS